MSSKTSARSPFWLTDRLGLTSQPTNSFGRGEIETVKHPLRRCTRRCRTQDQRHHTKSPRLAPAVDLPYLRLYVRGVTGPEPIPNGISRYGAIPLKAAVGFPRRRPPALASSLVEAAG